MKEVEKLHREAKGLKIKPRVFCASLADVFDAEVPDHWRKELYSIIRKTTNLNYLLLTKRSHLIEEQLKVIGEYNEDPLDNVWLGFTAENQEWFDRRWEHHSEIPAKIRFVSYEPALGPIKLPKSCRGKLHWLIIGGETTSQKGKSRPMNPDWVNSIKEQCEEIGIAFFFKQWGNDIPIDGDQQWFGKSSKTFKDQHDLFEGKKYQNFPI
jgi:protein gp37